MNERREVKVKVKVKVLAQAVAPAYTCRFLNHRLNSILFTCIPLSINGVFLSLLMIDFRLANIEHCEQI